MNLSIIPNKFAICRLDPDRKVPDWALNDIFFNISKTTEEFSVVTLQNSVPLGIKAERDWRIIKVAGPMDLNLTGVLLSIARPLADGQVAIFALSTYDTDYIMVKDTDLEKAKRILIESGFEFNE